MPPTRLGTFRREALQISGEIRCARGDIEELKVDARYLSSARRLRVSPHFLDYSSRSLPSHFTITRPVISHNLCGLEHQFFVHALLSLSYHVTLSASLCASACGSISKRLLASWIDRDISYYYNAQGYSKRYSLLESLYATPSVAEPPRSFPTNYNKNYFRFTMTPPRKSFMPFYEGMT
jgi:hypothetical protein